MEQWQAALQNLIPSRPGQPLDVEALGALLLTPTQHACCWHISDMNAAEGGSHALKAPCMRLPCAGKELQRLRTADKEAAALRARRVQAAGGAGREEPGGPGAAAGRLASAREATNPSLAQVGAHLPGSYQSTPGLLMLLITGAHKIWGDKEGCPLHTQARQLLTDPAVAREFARLAGRGGGQGGGGAFAAGGAAGRRVQPGVQGWPPAHGQVPRAAGAGARMHWHALACSEMYPATKEAIQGMLTLPSQHLIAS